MGFRLADPAVAARYLVEGSFWKLLYGMRAVGLKVLKNKLSEYVRLAAGGEVVLITDRDRVVAELVPPRPGRAEWVSDSQLAEAVRQGWITPALIGGTEAPSRAPIASLDTLLAELASDRADR